MPLSLSSSSSSSLPFVLILVLVLVLVLALVLVLVLVLVSVQSTLELSMHLARIINLACALTVLHFAKSSEEKTRRTAAHPTETPR